jgi:bifunctional ADP-heptose synthase (sugar kinase/adenylyltransferase)
VPGFVIEARDTTGAGDSFAAGFIAGLLSGLNWTGAAVLGNAVGAMSVTQAGAGMQFPRAQEALLILLKSRGKPLHRKELDAIQQLIDRLTLAPEEPKEEREPWWA